VKTNIRPAKIDCREERLMPNPSFQPDLPPEPLPGHARPQAPPRDLNVQQGNDILPSVIPYKNPRALIAYYCGVFALIPCLGLLLGPAALILGILGVRYAAKNPAAKGMAHGVVGIVLGSLAALLNFAALIFVFVAAAGNRRFLDAIFG
jgi:hypothetical protein